MDTFVGAYERFSMGVKTLAASAAVAQKRLEVEFSELDIVVKRHEAALKEYRQLQQMMEEIAEKEGEDNPKIVEYQTSLKLLKADLDRLRDTKPKVDNGLFVRLMLGRVNMSLWKQADRMNFRDEYNKFKARTTTIFLLWPLLQLMLVWLAPALWAEQGELLLKTHQLWLLYYYLTLSLRENILLANGSAIMHWWIYHHYLSMGVSLCMLLFPNAYLLDRLTELLGFGMVQGLVMMFQNNYQKKRLYTRKALGKAKAIDVDSSETLVEKPTDLAVLIPMLFFLYAIELWFGCSFIAHYFAKGESIKYPFSLILLGVAFIVLGVGNAYTTGIVLVGKQKSRQLKQVANERKSSGGAPAKNNSEAAASASVDKKAA